MKLLMKYFYILFTIQITNLILDVNIEPLLYSSYITMKVKGPGEISIFHLEKNYDYYPNEIYINDAFQTYINFSYYLND